jgi:hypothetical protein
MLDRLLSFIHEYQNRVREATSLFRKHKGLENPAYWVSAGLNQSGFIDAEKTIEYFFHGAGCKVKLPSGEVDWNFAPEGHVGLDVGFLSAFSERGTENYPEFRDWEVLNFAFREAISQGLLRHYPAELWDQVEMYFLQSDVVDK